MLKDFLLLKKFGKIKIVFLGKIPLSLYFFLYSKIWVKLYNYEFDLPGISNKLIRNTNCRNIVLLMRRLLY